jgi:glyoxylase-like metal-dependent hydrolase (beta-lactamase superfamily II)
VPEIIVNMQIKSFVFNPFSENTYVLSDETGTCAIIDPGCYSAAEQQALEGYIVSQKLQPTLLLNTHAHIDHVLGNAFVHRRWGLTPQLHPSDLELLRSAPLYGELWGIRPEASPDPEIFLNDGDTVQFGTTKLSVRFVPGHCPGHVAFYQAEAQVVFSGDVLFAGSIGRTDLPGGDLDILMESIHHSMMILDDSVKVYSGHGPVTTIGNERISNPFL